MCAKSVWAEPSQDLSNLLKMLKIDNYNISATLSTLLTNFMPESATLPSMRNLLGSLSVTFEHRSCTVSINAMSLTVNAWWPLATEHSQNVSRRRTVNTRICMNLQHLSNPLIIAVLHVFPASPIDTATPQENERLATRHVDAEKPAFPTRPPPILKFCEHHQTGWNVRKCHVCHAKQHDNLLGNIRKGEVLQLPP